MDGSLKTMEGKESCEAILACIATHLWVSRNTYSTPHHAGYRQESMPARLLSEAGLTEMEQRRCCI